MALLPSAVPSSTDQINVSTSENAAPQSNPQSQQQQQQPQQQLQQNPGEASNEVVDDCDKPYLVNPFLDADTVAYAAKYDKYAADYVRRLNAKYFSKKAMNGVNIFDEETVIENEVIKSSSWPCTKSFIDPVQSAEDQSKPSGSMAEPSTSTPNRKYQSKKSS